MKYIAVNIKHTVHASVNSS